MKDQVKKFRCLACLNTTAALSCRLSKCLSPLAENLNLDLDFLFPVLRCVFCREPTKRADKKCAEMYRHVTFAQSHCKINPQPCPHVCVFTGERNFLLTDTASVHTYPMKTIDENGTFRKRSPDWNFLKTPFSRVRVDRRKRNFSKTLRTHYQFQSTLRKNLFNMADERFPFLSFILGLIFHPIACFQANSAFLILQADYSRRRQNIIRLLSMPVSRGGRLDLPPV